MPRVPKPRLSAGGKDDAVVVFIFDAQASYVSVVVFIFDTQASYVSVNALQDYNDKHTAAAMHSTNGQRNAG